MLFIYLALLFLQRVECYPETSLLSEPFADERDEFNPVKRTTKLKFGKLEHTPLDDDYVKGSIWPKPQHEDRTANVNFFINEDDFKIVISGEGRSSGILKSATERYKKLIFPKPATKSNRNDIKSLEIVVKTKKESLSFDMDESCKFI